MLEMRGEPGVEAAEADRPALQHVQEALTHTAVRPGEAAYLVGPNQEQIELPPSLFQILRQAAALLSGGHRVVLAPLTKEMTTQEAADLLNVSRPHLVKLLDDGLIPYARPGRHRRVKFGDVVKYMQQRNDERRQRLLDLIRQSEELGMYDIEEPRIGPTR